MSNPLFLIKRAHAVEPLKPSTASTAAKVKLKFENEKSIITSLKWFTMFSQILGILPQSNLNKHGKDMKFKWLSWRILYSLTVMGCLSVAVVCCLIFWTVYGSNIESIATGVFYGGSLATVILYLRLATSWAKLMKSWSYIDKIMNISYGYPHSLDLNVKFFTGIFLTLGVADYLLSVASRWERLTDSFREHLSGLQYYNDTFPQLFAYVPYSIGTAIFCTIITVHSNLAWALNDLFVIITSTALAMRFKQISQKLHKESDKQKTNSLNFWKEIREDYDRLANFCKELDSYISAIILLSYFLNIFFLLIQLYHSLASQPRLFSKVYFIFSFVYLIFKTTTVSLYAAWINDESKAPTSLLNSVDSSLYNIEIRRLLIQISLDKIYLTGCKMFCVKRGIILSVASAIVTYELVLIQFSEANLYATD